MFHGNKNICDIINGVAKNATSGVPAICACILPHYKLGTVRTLLKDSKPEFTTQSNGVPCLLLKHAIQMAKDVLSGLECMHEMRFAHRDIKPGNICVERLPLKDQVRLQYIIIDLGAAVVIKKRKVAGAEASGESEESQLVEFTGKFTSMAGEKMPLGTVCFMSPEHIDPSRYVDGRTDLFSLGVTMFECLSGRFPFVQPSRSLDFEMTAFKMTQRYGAAREADAMKIPHTRAQRRAVQEVVGIVAKSILRNRDERYANADAMKKDLERIDR